MGGKKRKGKKKTSALAYLYEEPYRTIIEIIYLLEENMGEAQPKQILYVFNAKEDSLYTKDVQELHVKIIQNRVYNKALYECNTKEVRRRIQSRPDKPKYNITRYNLRDYLKVLLEWRVVEKIERGSYKLTDSFKKEFVRKSNKEIMEGYIADEITDKARDGITLYGCSHIIKQLEKADGMRYINDIKSKFFNIRDELWQLSSDIQNAKDYLVNVFLSKELQTKPPAIKDFFSQHDLIALLDFQHTFNALDLMNFDAVEDYFPVKEVKIAKDYLKLDTEEQNILKQIISQCKEERIKLAYPFTLFYSDIRFSPTPLNLDAALKYAREKTIMEDNKLSFEQKTQYIGKLYLTPDDIAILENKKEETERYNQEIQEKLKEVGSKYDDNTLLGDMPEIREIAKKHFAKLLKERKVIEGES